jgi:inhibitor of cysteine peptidase
LEKFNIKLWKSFERNVQMEKIFLSSFLLAVILSGCHNQEATSIIVADNTGNIAAKVGDTFMIKLESNHTTGYSWRLADLKRGIIEIVSNVYEPSKTQSGIVGSGGIEEWTFKAIAKGKVIITLEYVRPWEKDVPPIKRALYQVIVK